MTVHVLMLAMVFGGTVLSAGNPAQSHGARPADVPSAWQTRAERTGYSETGGYDEVVAYCRKLAASSGQADFRPFGHSAQGRELPLLMLSREGGFNAGNVRAHGKLVVLLQNSIHPGECAGKEASLALARDIVVTGTRHDLLEHINLLIIPIFNVDGHERMSPHNRVNQNGPNAMGWRVTANNLNLNRDYTKVDAVEMRHWLTAWNRWRPDLLFDNHTTNGGDHRYALLYASAIHQETDPAVARWLTGTLYPHILPKMAADGHEVMPYFGLRERHDPALGVDGPGSFSPRFSTGYAGICDRPSILVEAHALKPFADRVRATYDIMVHTLEELNRDPDALRAALQEADARTVASRGAGENGKVALRLKRTDESLPRVFKGYRTTKRTSSITGAEVIEYTTDPVDIPTRYYDTMAVERDVVPPAAYLVPPQWDRACRILTLHGLSFFRLSAPRAFTVETYRFDNVRFADTPYEGRQRPSYDVSPVRQTKTFPAGTFVFPLNQPRAKVLVHLLEPLAPDALVAWGSFNAIFEQKEYAEHHRFEPLARAMLETDDVLKAAFRDKLAADAEFAASPRRRINFFYRRSRYWDAEHNVYPVGRLMDEGALDDLRRP